ncbi:hypothetical protein BcepSauron_137 [Burkholderia phage BcepSauron]|uniref:Uncharacterized protein n=2 Tax=Sarumanvirus TaxID=2843450 RepID=A0A482MKG3_9CAUD|nr:hypothetical protein H1O16_gp138 [Burkholderia phage BcepSaruman]YP_009904515.1 hypothetical protein H1O17_gp137 [Burkholderia phage BcepSauron]QBQ74517.1 hypothetical protein BcepSauron_137 [Burkholderia phage BcepSauron]QBX06551.1 hypothetical protein BcepSaruman_138 [Burkholderia phage BcepSaruman]
MKVQYVSDDHEVFDSAGACRAHEIALQFASDEENVDLKEFEDLNSARLAFGNLLGARINGATVINDFTEEVADSRVIYALVQSKDYIRDLLERFDNVLECNK